MWNTFFLSLLILLLSSCIKSEADSSNSGLELVNGPNSNTQDDSQPGNQGSAGYSEDNLSDITSEFTNLMSVWGLNGAQIAITHNEKLVYSESFGKSNLERNIGVNKTSLFRIADVSKQITNIAIHKLSSENALGLKDFVFGPNGILGEEYGTPPYEPQEESITISHLLEHKGGFTDDPYDIMFDDPSLSHAFLIGKVLDERSLVYEPGTKYVYSNFGYCLLGRVIEKVSGMSYEQYVTEHILAPMNITEMKIGGNKKEDAFEKEVTYYSNWSLPYAMNISRMDSHGGWIASAKDLALFAVHTDGNGYVLDPIISNNPRNGQWSQNAALPGTLAIMKVSSPISYVVLVNTSGARPNEVIQVISNFMNEKVNKRSKWPNIDLFNYL